MRHFCFNCIREWVLIAKCFFGFHQLWKVKKLSDVSDLIGCSFCNRFWAMNHRVYVFFPFDQEMCEMYTSFGIKGLNEFITKDRPFSMLRG
jgi:hypothetical protein